MNNFNRILLDLLYFPFFWASKILPNVRKVWLFGSWNGKGFKDNSRWLYEYVYNNKENNVEAYWVLESNGFISDIPKKYRKNILIKGTIKWLIYCCICRVVFYSHSPKSDVGLLANRDDVLKVQLWHGCPLKKIGSDDKIYTNKSATKINPVIKTISSSLMPYRLEKHDIVFCLSDYDKDIFEKIFNPELGCLKYGYPRNDPIKNNQFTNKNKSKNKHILYAPTFRKTDNPSLDEYGLTNYKLKIINSELSKSELTLNIRLHPAVNIESTKKLEFSNITFLSNEQDIVFDILQSEALITDYSSIAFDYLLYEKPIFFLFHDLEEYENNHRTFYPNILNNLCRPALKDWDEIIKDLNKVFIHNIDEFKVHREQVSKKYLENSKGNSSKKIYEWVTSQIEI